jgi:protocatechuate 3,4-dioxygenase beta subunit
MNGMLAPGPETCWRIMLSLLHAGWIGIVLALLAVVAGRLDLRRRAAWRYGVDCAALAALGLSLPLVYLLVGTRSGAIEPGTRAETPVPRPARLPAASLRPMPARGVAHPGPAARRADPEVRGALGGALGPPARDRDWRLLGQALAPYVTLGYALGVLLMFGRLGVAVGGGMRLRAAARVLGDGALVEVLREQGRRLGLAAVPVLGFCERAAVPVVLGLVRPMILLPAALATGLTPDELVVVLLHELAHLRRFDHVFILVQRGLEAVLFFHPAAWYLSRRIDRAREQCCDDLVLSAGGDRVIYAAALVRVAELSLNPGCGPAPYAAPAAAGRRPSELRRRIARLLEVPEEPAVELTRPGVLAFALLLLLTGATAAALLATDAPPRGAPPIARAESGKPAMPIPAPASKTSVTGRVLDVAGKPIPFALVGITHRNGYFPQLPLSQTIGGALADAAGRFALSAFDPGEYEVIPVPDVEIKGNVALPEAARNSVRKVASEAGTTRLACTVGETFAVQPVTIKAGAPPVDVVLKAVPHVTFTARFLDGQGKPAPARPGDYPIYGMLDGQDWTGAFRRVTGKPDTMIGLIPKALKDVNIQNDNDDTWWTWAPGVKRVSPHGIRLKELDGDRPAIVVERFRSNVLEIRLRVTAGKLPTNPAVHVSYPRRRGGDGGPIPKRVAEGVYRLEHMLLPGRDCEVVVSADGFKTASTKSFQFPGEGAMGIVEVTLTPGQRTNEWRVADAQPVVLRTPDGQPIAQPVEVKGPDRAIACRAIDQKTGRPVAGAVVRFEVTQWVDEDGEDDNDRLDSRETRTDADGRFTVLVPEKYLPDPAPKRDVRTRIHVEHPGYVLYWGEVGLRELAAKGVADDFPEFRTVKLVPARTLTGRLLDANGEPLRDVQIYKVYNESRFINLLDPPVEPALRDADDPRTGDDGRFDTRVPAGMALKLEFRTQKSARRYHDVAADATDLGDIRVTPGVRLKGVVLDEAGKPVPGISVTTPADVADSQPDFLLKTDKDGVFETDELPPGPYSVRVSGFTQDGPRGVGMPIRPPATLYLPVPFAVREGEPPTFLTVRPVPYATFVARLTTTRPQPGPAPEGKVLTDEENRARFAEAFFHFLVGLQVKGTYRSAAWASNLSWTDISDDGMRCLVRVPRGLEDARIEFSGVPERFRLKPDEPERFGPAIRLGRVESDLPAIALRRYGETTLRLIFKTPTPPRGNPPAEPRVEAHYTREPAMRTAGVIFERAFPEPRRQSDGVTLSLLPGEEVEVTVAGAAPVRVTLAEGETRNVTVDFPGT